MIKKLNTDIICVFQVHEILPKIMDPDPTLD
jgi:hypothetical protein